MASRDEGFHSSGEASQPRWPCRAQGEGAGCAEEGSGEGTLPLILVLTPNPNHSSPSSVFSYALPRHSYHLGQSSLWPFLHSKVCTTKPPSARIAVRLCTQQAPPDMIRDGRPTGLKVERPVNLRGG